MSGVVRIEEGDDEVDEDGQVKGNGSPQRHPSGEPVEHWHTCNTRPTDSTVTPLWDPKVNLVLQNESAQYRLALLCRVFLTPQLLLPLHLAVQEGGLFEEVRDL